MESSNRVGIAWK